LAGPAEIARIRRTGPVNKNQERQLAELLAIYREAELAVAAFYRVCANLCPEDAEFWKSIAAQEEAHAGFFARIQELFAAKPDAFQPGRPFSPVAVLTFIKGVQWNTERALKGELQRTRLIHVARDIENSLLESRFAECVRSEDADFTALMDKLMDETTEHHGIFSKMLAAAE